MKIADFGLAKLVGADEPSYFQEGGGPGYLTVAGELMGTPQYMAPEQIERPGEVDHRADIYSLGVVLYQMLTGGFPAPDFEPPSRFASVDIRLDEVVMRALEKDPERRYQNISLVRESVETILSEAVPSEAKGERTMEIKFNCPGCDQRLSIDETGAGSEVTCPNCSQSMTVPGLAPQPPPLRPSAAGWLPASRRARGWAITSFVLALIGLVPVLGLGTGLLGLVFGVVALVKGTTSRGLAIAGTAIGCVASLMIPLHLAMFGTAMAAAKFGAGAAQHTANLRLVGEGISAYRVLLGDKDFFARVAAENAIKAIKAREP